LISVRIFYDLLISQALPFLASGLFAMDVVYFRPVPPLEKAVFASHRLPFVACLLVVVTMGLGCRERARLTQLDDARSLAAYLRVQFNKAADASNRAVMADTDAASTAFAHESEEATASVQKDMTALAPLLESQGFSVETRILDEFKTHFSEYRELDRKVLALAVENTNLKAQSLSFGPARQAADKLKDSLAPVTAAFSAKDQCRAAALVAQAVTAVREIQALYAPHIAERNDASMTKMEQELTALDGSARGALKTLEELAPPNAHASLTTAHAALDELTAATAKIVELSRRNTDVLSLELSLGKKPTLAAACDERLNALQKALANEGSKATR
jgi:hypothetical protein